MKNVTVTLTEWAEETVEILAKAITEIADGFAKLKEWPLFQDTIILLLHQVIWPSKITKKEIKLVLDAMPLLKKSYVRPNYLNGTFTANTK